MTRDLLAALERGTLICDGAMGTMLMASGIPSRCPEELNLSSPDTVRAIHAAYVAARADIIETNSFGGSRLKLAKAGLPEKAWEANFAAARLAREVAGDGVLVAGSIGPLGEFLEPLGDLAYADAVSAFREQAEALAEGGADLFMVETMYDLSEARAAVEAAATTGKPVVATMSFDSGLRTMMGVSAESALAGLREAGAVLVGANCGVGPEEMLQVIQRMHRADAAVGLAAQPNAGVPAATADGLSYSVGPEEMAGFAKAFMESGVRILGSCCGSSPEHTRALVKALRG